MSDHTSAKNSLARPISPEQRKHMLNRFVSTGSSTQPQLPKFTRVNNNEHILFHAATADYDYTAVSPNVKVTRSRHSWSPRQPSPPASPSFFRKSPTNSVAEPDEQRSWSSALCCCRRRDRNRAIKKKRFVSVTKYESYDAVSPIAESAAHQDWKLFF